MINHSADPYLLLDKFVILNAGNHSVLTQREREREREKERKGTFLRRLPPTCYEENEKKTTASKKKKKKKKKKKR